jgi:hypothetical protein
MAIKELRDYSKLMRDRTEDERVTREEYIKVIAIIAKNIMERERENVQFIEQTMVMQVIKDPNKELKI